jgi:hypothetical protein
MLNPIGNTTAALQNRITENKIIVKLELKY